MRKLSKTLLSLLLIAAMLASFVVLPAAAEEPAAEQPTEAVQAAETQAADDTSYRYNIVHVDAGRKYFSPTSIKAIIDNAAEAGFNQVELYLSDNQGFRFALDDMTVTTSTGNTYDLSAALGDGYTASDGKCPDGSDKYLTQSEMTDIIAYARSKNVEIVPCVNAPGHMGAILEEFSDFRYTSGWQTSKSSIDLGNAEAVAFALAITDKYAKYFASQGCKYYNIGADEYANDLSSMGFENMGSALYTKFVEFMNSAADIIVGYGMTPRAFNDGFCYNKNEYNSVTVAPSKAYEICYWSSGWNGYNVASAKTLSSNGYKLINTNGDYYWVLGNSGWQCSANKASGFDYTNFSGNTKISSPSGSMFCIWCDFGNTNGADGGTQVVSDTADVIAAFGKALPTVRNNTATDENKTVFDSSFPGISVTGPNLTKVTVTETSAPTNLPAGVSAAMAWDIVPYVGEDEYHDTAKVTLPIPTEWTGADVYGGVMNENGGIDYGKDYDIKDGFLTFTAPHFSTVVVLAEPQQKSLVVPTNGTKTVEENGNLTGYTPEYSKDGIVKLEMSFANDVTTMTFTGLANGDVSVTVGNLVYQITVTNESYSSKKTITVAVGGTVTDTVDGEVSSTYTDDFVSVKTETKDKDQTYIPAELAIDTLYVSTKKNDTAPTLLLTFEDAGNGQYYIKNGNDQYISPLATTSFYGIYWDYNLSTTKNPVNISKNTDGGIIVSRDFSAQYGNTTAYLSISSSGSFVSTETNTKLYLYDVEPANKQTTISFTGKQVGTTQVKIGDVLYTIVVEDKAPDGAMTNTSLTLEYWITNSMVYDGTSTSTNHTKSITTTTTGANTDEGIAIEGIAPSPAYTFFDGRVTVYYWQAMRLDKDNKQTDTSGDDETADGTTFTHVRYHAGAWQYKTLDGTWHYFLSTDQAVAYYLQKTEVTKEVETYVKDWGYGTAGTTPNTSSGKGQVALTVAVVYPDGTVSPAERDMYSKSTTIFNYWDGRDIGIIAPKNNEDYTISKITVTDGNRKSNSTENVWYTSDTITWAKTTLDDEVTEWYNEREVWNKSSGTTPMVNGKSSKETWSAKNTAKLVLIYLEAAEKESNLNVVYYDDTYSKEIISSQIVMSYTQGQEPPTYLNSLQNNGTVTPGTITLADEAYVTNSSGVNQTFNKNVATVPGVAAQYRSGLYKYVSAEISEDGKTLTLHYKISANNLKKYYVVDFGLPVQFELTDLVDDTNLSKVRISTVTDGNVTYDETTKTFTYTPTEVLKSLATASIAISYTGKEEAILTVGFIPASTVYYEEGFASYSANWVSEGTAHGARQAKEPYGQATNSYGFDPAYRENSANSEGTVARTTTVGSDATFKFNGTGLELYLRTQNANNTTEPSNEAAQDATNHSYMLVQVYAGDTADANNLKRMSFVDVNNLFVQKDVQYGYNTPCWTVDEMALNDYTVVVRFVKGQELAIDGFRVTGTQGERYEKAYARDGEANMQTAEIRNMVLAQANVSNAIFGMSAPMYQVGVDEVLDAVFDDKDVISGAAIIASNGTVNTNVTVDKDLVNIGPKNEIYLEPGQAVVMQFTKTYASVQVGMRSLTGAAVTYQINSETAKTMNSTVDMYYPVKLVGNMLVIRNTSENDEILALTKLKVTSATAATGNDPGVVPQTTPEAIRYAMALMRGIDVPEFTDVPKDAWYHDYVYDLVYRGVVNGMTATTYEPEGKLTRAQFVKLLACSLADAETLKTYEGKHPFKDSEGHWAETYIAWAKDKGIVEGVSATEFDPEAPITREQMATIFGRYALKQGIELPKSDNAAGSFPDADKISEYAREFVELMRIAGILNGYEDGTFRPQGNATRAEAAKLFSLFLSITDKLAK